MVKVDVIVRKDGEYRRVEFARRRRAAVEATSSRGTRAAVQLADVRGLLGSAPDIDRIYLEQWTERLGLGPLYREVA